MERHLTHKTFKKRLGQAGLNLTTDQLDTAYSIVTSGVLDVKLMLKLLTPSFSEELITTSLNVMSKIEINL